jgi:hypothetical protein
MVEIDPRLSTALSQVTDAANRLADYAEWIEDRETARFVLAKMKSLRDIVSELTPPNEGFQNKVYPIAGYRKRV